MEVWWKFSSGVDGAQMMMVVVWFWWSELMCGGNGSVLDVKDI
jgi:hypothetical protein